MSWLSNSRNLSITYLLVLISMAGLRLYHVLPTGKPHLVLLIVARYALSCSTVAGLGLRKRPSVDPMVGVTFLSIFLINAFADEAISR